LRRLAAEIRVESEMVERVVSDIGQGAALAGRRGLSFLEIRGLADLLHDFYTGIEKVFRRIAPELNGGLPEGDAWHRQLLDNMAMEIPTVRPAVISKTTAASLDEFLRFRHLFRNVYGFELDGERVVRLCAQVPAAWATVREEFRAFLGFLEQLAEGIR